MKVIGLLGGIASGKSWVAQQLSHFGAEVLDADQAAHVALQDPQVIQAAVERWGPKVLQESDGDQPQLNRSTLASLVFSDSPSATQQRRFLEQLVHPVIRKQFEHQLRGWRDSGEVAVAVLDAPLLLEAGWGELCDELWFVDTPDEVRAARARLRGWTEKQWREREQAQQTLDLKRRRADRIIPDQGAAQTINLLKRWWDSLTPPTKSSTT